MGVRGDESPSAEDLCCPCSGVHPKSAYLRYVAEEDELEAQWGNYCMALSGSLLMVRGDVFDVSTDAGIAAFHRSALGLLG